MTIPDDTHRRPKVESRQPDTAWVKICILDIKEKMISYKLQLNENKTEFDYLSWKWTLDSWLKHQCDWLIHHKFSVCTQSCILLRRIPHHVHIKRAVPVMSKHPRNIGRIRNLQSCKEFRMQYHASLQEQNQECIPCPYWPHWENSQLQDRLYFLFVTKAFVTALQLIRVLS